MAGLDEQNLRYGHVILNTLNGRRCSFSSLPAGYGGYFYGYNTLLHPYAAYFPLLNFSFQTRTVAYPKFTLIDDEDNEYFDYLEKWSSMGHGGFFPGRIMSQLNSVSVVSEEIKVAVIYVDTNREYADTQEITDGSEQYPFKHLASALKALSYWTRLLPFLPIERFVIHVNGIVTEDTALDFNFGQYLIIEEATFELIREEASESSPLLSIRGASFYNCSFKFRGIIPQFYGGYPSSPSRMLCRTEDRRLYLAFLNGMSREIKCDGTRDINTIGRYFGYDYRVPSDEAKRQCPLDVDAQETLGLKFDAGYEIDGVKYMENHRIDAYAWICSNYRAATLFSDIRVNLRFSEADYAPSPKDMVYNSTIQRDPIEYDRWGKPTRQCTYGNARDVLFREVLPPQPIDDEQFSGDAITITRFISNGDIVYGRSLNGYRTNYWSFGERGPYYRFRQKEHQFHRISLSCKKKVVRLMNVDEFFYSPVVFSGCAFDLQDVQFPQGRANGTTEFAAKTLFVNSQITAKETYLERHVFCNCNLELAEPTRLGSAAFYSCTLNITMPEAVSNMHSNVYSYIKAVSCKVNYTNLATHKDDGHTFITYDGYYHDCEITEKWSAFFSNFSSSYTMSKGKLNCTNTIPGVHEIDAEIQIAIEKELEDGDENIKFDYLSNDEWQKYEWKTKAYGYIDNNWLIGGSYALSSAYLLYADSLEATLIYASSFTTNNVCPLYLYSDTWKSSIKCGDIELDYVFDSSISIQFPFDLSSRYCPVLTTSHTSNSQMKISACSLHIGYENKVFHAKNSSFDIAFSSCLHSGSHQEGYDWHGHGIGEANNCNIKIDHNFGGVNVGSGWSGTIHAYNYSGLHNWMTQLYPNDEYAWELGGDLFGDVVCDYHAITPPDIKYYTQETLHEYYTGPYKKPYEPEEKHLYHVTEAYFYEEMGGMVKNPGDMFEHALYSIKVPCDFGEAYTLPEQSFTMKIMAKNDSLFSIDINIPRFEVKAMTRQTYTLWRKNGVFGASFKSEDLGRTDETLPEGPGTGISSHKIVLPRDERYKDTPPSEWRFFR